MPHPAPRASTCQGQKPNSKNIIPWRYSGGCGPGAPFTLVPAQVVTSNVIGATVVTPPALHVTHTQVQLPPLLIIIETMPLVRAACWQVPVSRPVPLFRSAVRRPPPPPPFSRPCVGTAFRAFFSVCLPHPSLPECSRVCFTPSPATAYPTFARHCSLLCCASPFCLRHSAFAQCA